MKKVVRINVEMRYINNRQTFTVNDIMHEFQISRRTAIRDLGEIQELGLPLYARSGHNGGYQVMQNQTLPPVSFTPVEIRALFVAFIATTNEQLPYLRNRQSISEKLLAIIPGSLKDQLLELQTILWFENTNADNPTILELVDQAPEILQALLDQIVTSRQLKIDYQKPQDDHGVWHDIFVAHVYQSHTYWYVNGYDLTRQASRSFRVDRILEIGSSTKPQITKEQIKLLEKAQKPQPNVELKLGGEAIERFDRFHQPGMRLSYLDAYQQTAKFSTYIQPETKAMHFFADWLLFLGDDVTIVKIPSEIKTIIQEKLTRWLK